MVIMVTVTSYAGSENFDPRRAMKIGQTYFAMQWSKQEILDNLYRTRDDLRKRELYEMLRNCEEQIRGVEN